MSRNLLRSFVTSSVALAVLLAFTGYAAASGQREKVADDTGSRSTSLSLPVVPLLSKSGVRKKTALKKKGEKTSTRGMPLGVVLDTASTRTDTAWAVTDTTSTAIVIDNPSPPPKTGTHPTTGTTPPSTTAPPTVTGT